MDTLTIESIRYKNFKGLADFTLNLNSGNATVSGANAVGKTSLFDGFTWLLFGKDSAGKADSQIKPVDKKGKERNNLDVEVEAVLLYNEKKITLLRRFTEKWTKQRGTATKDFTGHTTVYFIDEIPIQKKEFDAKIAEFIDTNAFRLVTNPAEFNSLHWQERRGILLQICGNISDQDAISSDDQLSCLTEILSDCTADDHKKKIKAKQAKINKELEAIPTRVDEQTTISKNEQKPDSKDLYGLESSIEEHKEKLRDSQNGKEITQKTIQVNELTSKILAIENKAAAVEIEWKKPINAELEKLAAYRRSLVNDKAALEDEVARDINRNKVNAESREKLRQQYRLERDEKQKPVRSCPTCGQEWPKEKAKAAIEKHNTDKAERLKKNMIEGRSLKSAFDHRATEIEESKKTIDKTTTQLLKLEKDTKSQQKKLDAVSEPAETETLEKEKATIEAEILAIQNGAKPDEEKIKEKIEELQNKIDAWRKQEASFEAAEESRARIKELETQEKTLAAAYEKLESEMFLIEKLIVAKVNLLESRVNEKFEKARFKMFDKQINGGIKECCETTYNGVPYNHGLNNSARINVGLDIIVTLSEHYGFKAPIFVDNSESVNELIEMDTQVIALAVSEDQELIVL